MIQIRECYIDVERVKNFSDQFQCLVCLYLVDDPQECPECGCLIGKICLNDWRKKSNQCPKCRQNAYQFRNVKGALLQIYKNLDIMCKYKECGQYIKLIDLLLHEENCQQKKCQQFQICGKLANSIFIQTPLCSLECGLLSKILTHKNDKNLILEEIHDYKKNIIKEHINKNQEQIKPILNIQNGNFSFRFSNIYIGDGIQLSNNNMVVQLKDKEFVFRTILVDTPFQQGIHYWEIVALKDNENEMKIGVTSKIPDRFNTSFTDYPTGFGFYGIGQLRNGSNGQGIKFGERYKNQGNIGILLDMNRGQLSFGLQKIKFFRNGKCWGVGFTDARLKSPNLIYPAISLLHQAGCQLIPDLPVPESFKHLLN